MIPYKKDSKASKSSNFPKFLTKYSDLLLNSLVSNRMAQNIKRSKVSLL